jgi:hypothetical protein
MKVLQHELNPVSICTLPGTHRDLGARWFMLDFGLAFEGARCRAAFPPV